MKKESFWIRKSRLVIKKSVREKWTPKKKPTKSNKVTKTQKNVNKNKSPFKKVPKQAVDRSARMLRRFAACWPSRGPKTPWWPKKTGRERKRRGAPLVQNDAFVGTTQNLFFFSTNWDVAEISLKTSLESY